MGEQKCARVVWQEQTDHKLVRHLAGPGTTYQEVDRRDIGMENDLYPDGGVWRKRMTL